MSDTVHRLRHYGYEIEGEVHEDDPPVNHVKTITLRAASGIAEDPYRDHHILIDGARHTASRGIRMVVLDPFGEILSYETFDTHSGSSEQNAMANKINDYADPVAGNTFFFYSWDQPEGDTATLREAMRETLGLEFKLTYRCAYAAIARVGTPIFEEMRDSGPKAQIRHETRMSFGSISYPLKGHGRSTKGAQPFIDTSLPVETGEGTFAGKGTVNHAPNPDFSRWSDDTNLYGYSFFGGEGGAGHVRRYPGDGVFGNQCVLHTKDYDDPGYASYRMIRSGRLPASQFNLDNYFTMSFWAKPLANVDQLRIRCEYRWGTDSSQRSSPISYIFHPKPGWHRYEATGYIPATNNGMDTRDVMMIFGAYTPQSNHGEFSVLLDGVMLEQNTQQASAPSMVEGGSSDDSWVAAPTIDVSNDFTVSVDVLFGHQGNSQYGIYGQNGSWYVRIRSGNNIGMGYMRGSSYSANASYYDPIPDLEGWHRVTTTYNVSNRQVHIYIDDKEVHSGTLANTLPSPSEEGTGIGTEHAAYLENPVETWVRNYHQFDRVLSADEVKALAGSRLNTMPEGSMHGSVREEMIDLPSTYIPIHLDDVNTHNWEPKGATSMPAYGNDQGVWVTGETINLLDGKEAVWEGFGREAHMTETHLDAHNPFCATNQIGQWVHPASQDRGGDQRLYQDVTNYLDWSGDVIYCYSFYVWIPSSSDFMSSGHDTLRVRQPDDGQGAHTGKDLAIRYQEPDYDIRDQWQRCWVSFRPDPNESGRRAFVLFYHKLETEHVFYTAAGMLELGTKPSPFTETTRPMTKIDIAPSEYGVDLNEGPWTIGGWFYPNRETHSESGNPSGMGRTPYMEIGNYHQSGESNITVWNTGSSYRAEMNMRSDQNTLSSPDIYFDDDEFDDWLFVTMRRYGSNSNHFTLSIFDRHGTHHKVEETSHAMPNIPDILHIGSYAWSDRDSDYWWQNYWQERISDFFVAPERYNDDTLEHIFRSRLRAKAGNEVQVLGQIHERRTL